MFEVAEQEFGEIDVVCPGAGVFEPVQFPFLMPIAHHARNDIAHSHHKALDELLASSRYA